VVLPPIIRSAYTCIYSIWYLSHRYCYLPLSVGTNRFECGVGGVRTYVLTMHGPINVKTSNNISKWQMGINSAFKGLSFVFKRLIRRLVIIICQVLKNCKIRSSVNPMKCTSTITQFSTVPSSSFEQQSPIIRLLLLLCIHT
jgi:hypothetical protein